MNMFVKGTLITIEHKKISPPACIGQKEVVYYTR